MKISVFSFCFGLALVCGCSPESGKNSTSPGQEGNDGHGHSHGPGESHGHAHEAAKGSGLPHGGTPVQVGPHDFHLELVIDPTVPKIQAFVLDDHAEKPVGVSENSFEMLAKLPNGEERLSFSRVMAANASTSSEFEAKADWLKTTTEFEGTIPTITLKGETFTNITFSYPEGKIHKH